jgi:hypothetical protein
VLWSDAVMKSYSAPIWKGRYVAVTARELSAKAPFCTGLAFLALKPIVLGLQSSQHPRRVR